MSTKMSLRYKAKSFHLYAELADSSGAVYLRLTDPVFRADRMENGELKIMVRIPREVWNEIITVGKREKEQED